MKSLALSLSWALLGLVGCGGDDAEPGIRIDAGGRSIMVDAARGEDAGSGPVTEDAGGAMCPPTMLPPPSGMACSAETFSCLMGAAPTAEAQQACWMADPDPEGCFGCAQAEVLACATRNGCDDEAGVLDCCIRDNCAGVPEAELQACLMANCVPQFNGLAMCADSLSQMRVCGISGLCFPAAMLQVEAAQPFSLPLLMSVGSQHLDLSFLLTPQLR